MRFKNNPSLLFLLLLSLFSQPLWAEETKDNADTEQSQSKPAPIPQTLKSPRATMETFLHAMNDIKRGAPERIDAAITTLDLSAINSLVRKEQGSDLAWMLIEVMDRTRVVDLKKVPNHSDGPTYLFHRYQHGDIRIARTESGAWLFDQNTISQLPAIMDEVAETQRVDGKQAESSKIPWHIRFRQQIPASFKATTFLLPNWQWLGLLFTIMLGVVADKLLSFFLRSGVRRWRNRTKHPEFKEISADILRPLGLMAMALIWWSGINLMGLSENVMLILLVAVKFLASISGVWAAYRLVDLVSAFLHKRAQMTENKLDDALV
ncbi:MAG: hypothetical protein AB2727_02375, partial [Candidatus Thiodiazotropha taylori]